MRQIPTNSTPIIPPIRPGEGLVFGNAGNSVEEVDLSSMIHLAQANACSTNAAVNILDDIAALQKKNDWTAQKAWIVRRYNGHVKDLEALGCLVESGQQGSGGGGSGQSSSSGDCSSTKAKNLLKLIADLQKKNDWAAQKAWIVRRYNGHVSDLAALGCSVDGGQSSGGGASSGQGGSGGGSGGAVTVDASGAADIGVHTGGSNPSAALDFGKLTGANVRVWMNFIGKNKGWAILENGTSVLGKYKNFQAGREPFQLVISYGPMPSSEGKGKAVLEKCAAGSYNSHYAKFGKKLKSLGLSDVILRVGWEWNGTTFPWAGGKNTGNLNLFAGCYRQVVKTIRAAYPGNKLLFDWSPTQWASNTQLNAAWPGGDYVDYVGSDTYDRYFGSKCGSNNECRWLKTKGNLNRILSFAKSKGKTMSVPEWGVWSGNSTGGGDNAYYVQQMAKFFKDNKSNIGYHIYFNVNSTGEHRLSKHPKALAAYRSAFGG